MNGPPHQSSDPLRLVVDLRPLQHIGTRRRGIGRVVSGLVGALGALDGVELWGATAGAERPQIPAPQALAGWRPLPSRMRGNRVVHRLTSLVLPPTLSGRPTDGFLATDVLQGPVRGVRPRIAICYDLIPLNQPDKYLVPRWAGPFGRWLRPLQHAIYRILLHEGFQRADRVVAISQASADDLVDRLGVEPHRIAVAPPGISPCFRPADEPGGPTANVAEGGIPGPYILHVGGVDPRKRVECLVRALPHLRPVGEERPYLVLLGAPPGPARRALEGLAENLGVARQLICPGWVANPTLVRLYQQALAVAVVSQAEGFSLPPLEALACGTPVVVPRDPPVPADLGGLGLEADPLDTGELVQALERAWADRSWRERVRRHGPVHARRYTWARMAGTVAQVLEGAVMTIPRPRGGRPAPPGPATPPGR